MDEIDSLIQQHQALTDTNNIDSLIQQHQALNATAQPQPVNYLPDLQGAKSTAKNYLDKVTRDYITASKGKYYASLNPDFLTKTIGNTAQFLTDEAGNLIFNPVFNTLNTATLGALGYGLGKAGQASQGISNVTGAQSLYDMARQKIPQSLQENYLTPLSQLGNAALTFGTGGINAKTILKAGEALPDVISQGKVASELSKGQKALTNIQKPLPIVTAKVSEHVPDIDELEKKIELEPGIPDIRTTAPLTSKMIKKQTEENKPEGKGVLSTLSNRDANLLSEKITTKDTPFTDYALKAIKAKDNVRELTPRDIFGQKAVKTLNYINQIRQDVGEAKGEFLKTFGQNRIDLSGISDMFKKMISERTGFTINDEGKVVEAPGRFARNPSDAGSIQKMWNKISKADANVTAQMADDLKSSLSNIFAQAKAKQIKPQFTPAEGVSGNISSFLDSKLKESLGDSYSELNTKYSRLKKITYQLNRRLGEVVDPETGTPSLVASLMKSAIMSNSDRGTKALFQAVKQITGVDLIKEAGFAEMAMRGAGDDPIRDLLKDVGPIATAPTHGIFYKALQKWLEAAGNKIRGNNLEQMINYYNKAQMGTKKIVGSESGSVGGYDELAGLQSTREGFTPAIKNPITGEINTGFAHKAIIGKITRQDENAGDLLRNELFKDNTGKYSDYIGFVDKKGNFITRKEAEKSLESNKTLAQQYHGHTALKTLGLTAGIGIGGITLAHLGKRNKK